MRQRAERPGIDAGPALCREGTHSRTQQALPTVPARDAPTTVRVVGEAIAKSGERQGAVPRATKNSDAGTEPLRSPVKQADVDGGKQSGATSAERRRISDMERETQRIGARHEMLKAAVTNQPHRVSYRVEPSMVPLYRAAARPLVVATLHVADADAYLTKSQWEGKDTSRPFDAGRVWR